MNGEERICLVTGANRGIGVAIVKGLVAKGARVFATARDPAKLEDLLTDWNKDRPGAVEPLGLDVTDPASVRAAVNRVEIKAGRLDTLVNNAGILEDRELSAMTIGMDLVRRTFETNTVGPWVVTQAFVPLLKKSRRGRVVMMSSTLGQLETMDDSYPAYRLSKTALNAVTRMFADALEDDKVLVNACCPGHVKTDMGGAEAPKSVEEGADTPVWLATLPDNGTSGGYFRDRRPIGW